MTKIDLARECLEQAAAEYPRLAAEHTGSGPLYFSHGVSNECAAQLGAGPLGVRVLIHVITDADMPEPKRSTS